MPDPKSPLSEADSNSFQEFFERINEKLILGVPEQITNDELKPMIERLWAQRRVFLEEQDKIGKAPSAKRVRQAAEGKKATSVAEALDLNMDDIA